MMVRNKLREAILTYVQEEIDRNGSNVVLQTVPLLSDVSMKLGIRHDRVAGLLLLDELHELFRTGYFTWGSNLDNPSPPFFHATSLGHRTLGNLSRDPSNPKGYLSYLSSKVVLNPVAEAYIREALSCFVGGAFKSSAVMTGAAVESLVLELRDLLQSKMKNADETVPSEFSDKRLIRILQSLKRYFEKTRDVMPYDLREAIDSFWSAYIQTIRLARNDAGHPSSIEPITETRAYSSLLMFPDLGKLSQDIRFWIEERYS